jgi:hypothetical protein
MSKLFVFFLLFPINLLFGQEQSGYPEYVGDITFNKETDREDFVLCNRERIYQYFNNSGGLEYEGGKVTIEKIYAEKYKPELLENETGLIRINFMVNCKGETDRFRLIAMDEDYHEKFFPRSVTGQLMEITESLNGWKIKRLWGEAVDYYQYLIFKIEDGILKEILP